MICDGLIFAVIAFAFILPLESLYDLIISSILFKAFISIIDTPLFAIFRIKMRKIEREK